MQSFVIRLCDAEITEFSAMDRNTAMSDGKYICTRAPHGRRHSPAPMLRVGQGSTPTTQGVCSCPIWHALNFKVIPRVSYEHTWDSESHALTKEKT